MSAFIDLYNTTLSRVDELDEILDAGMDQKSAGRRAISNQLAKAQEEAVADVLSQFKAGIEDDSEDVKFGFYLAFMRGLRAEYEDEANAYCDSLVEKRPAQPVDMIELVKANEERSAAIAKLKPISEVIKMMDPELYEKLPDVPRRRSLGGAKGKRAVSYYSWNLDGEDFDGSLTELAKHIGYTRPADLRDQMKAAGINLTAPPATIEFTNPEGRKIVGIKDPNAPDWSASSNGNGEVDEDEDEDELEDATA